MSIDELYEIQSGMQRERRRDVTMRELIEDAQMRSDANDQSVSNVAKHVATEDSPFPLPLTEPVGFERETANSIGGQISAPLTGGDWMDVEGREVDIDGDIDGGGGDNDDGDDDDDDDDDDDGFSRDIHASVHERMSAMESLEGGNPLARSNNLKTRGMTMDDKPRGVSFGGVGRLSAADDGSGFARSSLGVGGMRDSRNSSTAVRPSMMHARSSQLNKRLQSMKASEDASTTAGGGGGGRGGRRSSHSNNSLVNRESASASATSSGSVSDAFGARERAVAAGPWTEHIDAASGKPYWHHTDTGETTWDKPDSPPRSDERGAAAAAAASELPFARKSEVRRKTKQRVRRGLSTGAAAEDDRSESDSDAESTFL